MADTKDKDEAKLENLAKRLLSMPPKPQSEVKVVKKAAGKKKPRADRSRRG
jgi:hypothetical protein